MVPLPIQLASSTLRKVIKRLHYPLEVMLGVRALVRGLLAEPAQSRRDDGRARGGRRPFHGASLGAEDAAGSGGGVSQQIFARHGGDLASVFFAAP
jgi:hypothetical protein